MLLAFKESQIIIVQGKKSLNLPVRQLSSSNISLVLCGHYALWHNAKALLTGQKTLLAFDEY